MNRPAVASVVLAAPVVFLAGALLLAGGLLRLADGADVAVLHAVQQALGWAGEGFWSAWSVAGLGLSALLMVMALDRHTHRAVAAALLCLPIGGLLTHLPKLFMPTLRPAAVLPPGELLVMGEPIVRAASMPSGHALTALAMALVLHRCWPMGRGARALVWGLALLVPISRLLTGAHWPSDVLAGAGLGLCTGALAVRLARRWRVPVWLRRPAGQRLLMALELLGGLALLLTHTGYPAAQPLQWTLAGLAALSAWARWRRWCAQQGGQVPTPAATLRRWGAHRVLGALLAGLLLSVLLTPTAWEALALAGQRIPPTGWVLALLGWWGSYALRTERLRREWARWAAAQQPPRPAPGWAQNLDLFLAHNASLVLLPMRAGEAGYPLWLHQRWGVPLREALRSLLWLRVQDAAVLTLLALPIWLAPPLAGPLVLAGLGLAAWLSHSPRAAWLRPATAPVPARPAAALWIGWLLTLLNWWLRLLVIGALLSTWLGLGWAEGWRAALGGEWAAALPLQAPAGLGSYEAGAWAALAWGGPALPAATLAALVPAALALHLATVLLALVSWALWQALRSLQALNVPGAASRQPAAIDPSS